jgi:hypothetical protein
MSTGQLEWTTEQTVTRLETPLRSPSTPMERRVLGALEHQRQLALDVLVDRVAADLYRDELRRGGWVADIGFMGSALFRADVQRALDGATGALWTIKTAAR